MGGEPIPTGVLAVMVYMSDERLAELKASCGNDQVFRMTLAMRPPTPSQRSAVGRACNLLWRGGLISASLYQSLSDLDILGLA